MCGYCGDMTGHSLGSGRSMSATNAGSVLPEHQFGLDRPEDFGPPPAE
jgi:hypothetical protein